MEIEEKILVSAPIERCFDLVRSIDLHEEKSFAIGAVAKAGKTKGLSELGDNTIWSGKFLGVRSSMNIVVTEVTKHSKFCEEMVSGVPKTFSHEYTFRKTEDELVEVTDKLGFSSRGWFLGSMLDSIYFSEKMRALVKARLEAIKSSAESDEWRKYLGDE